MEIKEIATQDCYDIRHRVLRAGMPFETCKFPEDDQEGTFHVGAFIDNKLVSIATFCKDAMPELLTEKRQYRLRGMATLPEYRHRHAASAIIEYAQQILQEQGYHVLWCNARISVGQYYYKCGFEAIGHPFDLEPIGPHVRMYKYI